MTPPSPPVFTPIMSIASSRQLPFLGLGISSPSVPQMSPHLLLYTCVATTNLEKSILQSEKVGGSGPLRAGNDFICLVSFDPGSRTTALLYESCPPSPFPGYCVARQAPRSFRRAESKRSRGKRSAHTSTGESFPPRFQRKKKLDHVLLEERSTVSRVVQTSTFFMAVKECRHSQIESLPGGRQAFMHHGFILKLYQAGHSLHTVIWLRR